MQRLALRFGEKISPKKFPPKTQRRANISAHLPSPKGVVGFESVRAVVDSARYGASRIGGYDVYGAYRMRERSVHG